VFELLVYLNRVVWAWENSDIWWWIHITTQFLHHFHYIFIPWGCSCFCNISTASTRIASSSVALFIYGHDLLTSMALKDKGLPLCIRYGVTKIRFRLCQLQKVVFHHNRWCIACLFTTSTTSDMSEESFVADWFLHSFMGKDFDSFERRCTSLDVIVPGASATHYHQYCFRHIQWVLCSYIYLC
jgi:hypothetical protein